MKHLVFDLTKIPFLKYLISTYRLTVEVHNYQKLFTESNLGDWFSSYVQFYSGGHFSERAAAAWQSGKVNHLNLATDHYFFIGRGGYLFCKKIVGKL